MRVRAWGLPTDAREVTHLQLQGQRLGPELGEGLQLVPAATVVYAYDNFLTSLAGLHHCKRLTMLYLQNNRLATMSGLEACANLRVLHLGHNRLSRVECLENCGRLEELHVSNQKAREQDGDRPLEFCPNSIAAIAYSLQSLSSAGNRLQDVGPLTMLQQLRSLDLSGNEFAQAGDLKDICCASAGWCVAPVYTPLLGSCPGGCKVSECTGHILGRQLSGSSIDQGGGSARWARSPKGQVAQKSAGTGLTRLGFGRSRWRRHLLMPNIGSATSHRAGRIDSGPPPSSAELANFHAPFGVYSANLWRVRPKLG